MYSDQATEIVSFWLADSALGPEQATACKPRWYRGGPELDAEIARRFGALVELACEGALRDWEQSAEGTLALVVLLDQFTRNLYRSTANAYRGDERALALLRTAIQSDGHRSLPVMGRIFLYHPYHHSESVTEQDEGVALVDAIRVDADPVWHEFIDNTVAGFSRHRDIVAQFGRFPHRNQVLGRQNTPQEAEFLAGGADHFGQVPGTGN